MHLALASISSMVQHLQARPCWLCLACKCQTRLESIAKDKSSSVIGPGKHLQHSLTFIGKARCLDNSRAPEKSLMLAGSGLSCKCQTRLERLAKDKSSNAFVPGKHLQHSLTITGKARRLSKMGAPEKSLMLVGSGLACKCQTRLESIAKDKSSSVFGPGKHLQHILTFIGNGICVDYSGALRLPRAFHPGKPFQPNVMCSALGQAPALTHKHFTGLERLAWNKR